MSTPKLYGFIPYDGAETSPEMMVGETVYNCAGDAVGCVANYGFLETCHADETETWQGVCMSKPIRYVRNLTIHVMECSACGRTFEHVNGPYKYCPHCGAKVMLNE